MENKELEYLNNENKKTENIDQCSLKKKVNSYTIKDKYRAVLFYDECKDIPKTAKFYSVSVSSIYDWIYQREKLLQIIFES